MGKLTILGKIVSFVWSVGLGKTVSFVKSVVSKQVTWCLTPSQPLPLYQGDLYSLLNSVVKI